MKTIGLLLSLVVLCGCNRDYRVELKDGQVLKFPAMGCYYRNGLVTCLSDGSIVFEERASKVKRIHWEGEKP